VLIDNEKGVIMKYLLGIDFGGGASKATLLSYDGKIAAEHSVEYPTLHPEAGACEQAPSDWVRALSENISALLKKSGALDADVFVDSLEVLAYSAIRACGKIPQGFSEELMKFKV
jgi:xylulokinase